MIPSCKQGETLINNYIIINNIIIIIIIFMTSGVVGNFLMWER